MITSRGVTVGIQFFTSDKCVLYTAVTVFHFLQAATDVWEYSGCYLAPNGGVMRTSVLGIHDFGNIDAVISNTMATCKVTHVDPRCIASCVAVTTAIAMMLQGRHLKYSGDYDVDAVIKDAYKYACKTFETTPEVILWILCESSTILNFNPLNPKIKSWIFICCTYSFPTEVVGRSW